MSVTIYERETGKPVTFAYMIDAKESVAGGYYTWNAPPKPIAKPVPPVEEKVAVEPAPMENVKSDPAVEKFVPNEPEDDPLVLRKPTRIVRK